MRRGNSKDWNGNAQRLEEAERIRRQERRKNGFATLRNASRTGRSRGKLGIANLPGLTIEEKSADTSRLAIGPDDGRSD
jgi:hypothetical protein